MKSFQRFLCRQQPSAARRLEATFPTDQTIPIFSVTKPYQLRALHQEARRNSSAVEIVLSPSARQSRPFVNPEIRPPNARTKHTFRAQRTNLVSFSSKAAMDKEPKIHNIFEPVTGTWQYVVADPATLEAVIIDPVLDYDPASNATMTTSADFLLALVEKMDYRIDRILETHCHADHLTAASYLQSRLAQGQGHKPRIGIGQRIGQVQRLFGQRYGIPAEEYEAAFDTLFEDDEMFDIGDLQGTAIHLPGHTPDHLGYMIGDNVFCGDSVFHADIGTARCDFPGGSANNLYQSGRKLLDMQGHVKIWTGHDYPPEERGDPVAYLTVNEHKERNKHLSDGISEEEYVALRKARDEQMSEPRLLHQSLQFNIRGGRLPKPTPVGLRMLHLPLKLASSEW